MRSRFAGGSLVAVSNVPGLWGSRELAGRVVGARWPGDHQPRRADHVRGGVARDYRRQRGTGQGSDRSRAARCLLRSGARLRRDGQTNAGGSFRAKPEGHLINGWNTVIGIKTSTACSWAQSGTGKQMSRQKQRQVIVNIASIDRRVRQDDVSRTTAPPSCLSSCSRATLGVDGAARASPPT